jgi:hypothetical protein
MSQVPTGTTFYVGSAFAAVQSVTAVSNAAEAVVTCAGHGFAAGDIVEITSGWGRLNLRYFKVKSPTTNNFTLDGEDTTSTTLFPAGVGIGSVRKVSTFTQIQQVLTASSSGGDPKTVNFKYIESDVENSINDGFSATSYTLDLDADSIGTAGYTALKTLTSVQSNTVMRMVTRSGSQVLVPCTVALNEAVSLADGQINRVKCAFNGNNRGTRYAS